MIDPVELKALVEKATDDADFGRTAADAREELRNSAVDLARQVLALSDEVERLKARVTANNAAFLDEAVKAEAAESEAQALRERMGEIERIATDAGRETRGVNLIPATEFLSIEDTRTLAREATVNFDRIAALSTTPKEKEGC